MAADQRKKKRVNAASLVGCTSREKYLANKKKKPVQQNDLNMRPNISLEWDNRKKSVVPKKEQIGFSKRHLLPFIEPGSQGHNILADVLPVPLEIFELENLYEVMSYEVWQRHLSDNERRFLAQFLPKELEPDRTVQDLLSGDSLHFGNPFMKWSASLCLGDLHPDDVLHDELSLKAVKQAYYSFIEKYHNDMIDKLEMWKEKWSSCKDLEVDIMENMWRKHGEKTLPASDARFSGTEENHVGTPDSCSWANSEIADSSENHNLGTVQGEPHRRRDLSEKIYDSSSSGQKLVATAPRKGEKLHKQNIQQNDGAKYMSYIKVSREQHERVKSSIKYAGNSIQSRSLNNVLGSFDALNVQPFARFEEEESKKLHECWVRFATKDIPVGFANWRKMQLQRQEQTQSLCEEIGQKVELQEKTLDAKDVSSSNLMELSNGEGEDPLSNTFEEVEKEQSDDFLPEQNGNEGPVHEMATEPEDEKEMSNSYIFEKHLNYDREMNEDDNAPNHVVIREQQVSPLNSSPSSSPGFLQDQHQQQIGSLGHISSMGMESHGSAKDEHPQTVSGYLGNMVPSSCDVWPVGDARSSYYTPYTSSTHELLIGHPPFMQEQAVQMVNLETVRQLSKYDRRQTTDVMPLFSSYSNQDRSEFLHSLLKGQSNLSYHQMQKHDFQCGNDVVMDIAQFSDMMRQKRLNDAYLHQESIYTGGRFAVPRQEDFPVNNNVHDWATSVRMNIGGLGQNCWYSASSSSSSSSSSLEASHGLNSGDQTLFSVLSECNELPRGRGGGVNGQLMGNYNSGGGSSNNFLAQSSNYSSGPEAVSKMNNLGWMGMGMGMGMGLPQQSSEIQDSIAKPFLRSWNQ